MPPRSKDRRTVDMFGAPPVPPQPEDKVFASLRWYQQRAHGAVFDAFKVHRSALVVMATGLGKTQLFSSAVKSWKRYAEKNGLNPRALVLAHREELIDQARKRLEQMTGELVEIEQGPLRSGKARIVVGSIQTVYREDRLARLERNGGFGLIVIDEAHHYVSPTYRVPLDFFKGAKVLGVTATPDRADARALGQIFDDVAYSMDLQDGIQQGYLVPLRGREVEVTEINLDGVATVGDDLNQTQLDETMLTAAEGVVKGMLHHSGERQGIVFFPGVASARLAAERFNALKPHSARSVDGETPKDERGVIMEAFRRGEFQFLTNCMVATEGFDAPSASVVGIARPTKSRSLYAQMVGRGTRVLAGVVDSIEGEERAEDRRRAIATSPKPGCLLIDFVGNNTKHALVTPMDLLGGNYDEPVRKRAKEIAAEADGEMDVQEALEQAKVELERKELKRIAGGITSRVQSTSREFNPFRHLGIDMEREDKYTLEYGYKPPTEAQLHLLKGRGYTDSELSGISRKTATKIISALFERQKKGLASKPQSDLLARNGIVDTTIPAKVASKVLTYITQQRKAGLPVDPAITRLLTSSEEF